MTHRKATRNPKTIANPQKCSNTIPRVRKNVISIVVIRCASQTNVTMEDIKASRSTNEAAQLGLQNVVRMGSTDENIY